MRHDAAYGTVIVDEGFRTKVTTIIASFREWSGKNAFAGCRLVHYCGVDLLGSQDLPLAEVESRIEGLVCEGFYVDWARHDGRLFIRVWEFGGPEPEWAKVFAEQPLHDIDDDPDKVESSN